MGDAPGGEDKDKKTCNYSGLLSCDEIYKHKLVLDSDGEPITRLPGDKTPPSGSYDLHIGDRHYLFEQDGHWKPVFLGGHDELHAANKDVDPSFWMELSKSKNKDLVIPPFCSAIIQLDETIDLYSVAKKENLMIAGRFDLKLSAIYKGLISQQATQVEPCYKGKLYCFIHNLGDQDVIIGKGNRVATIEFSYVGQGISEEERITIINNTINDYTTNKYAGNSFIYSIKSEEDGKEIHTGIGDIRWLKGDGRLPDQCGIAPIYKLVKGNVEEKVKEHLDKFETIESLAERVSYRIKERENSLRTVLLLVVAVITFFTTNLAIELRAELRYFSEEIAFLADSYASIIDINEYNRSGYSIPGAVDYCDESSDLRIISDSENPDDSVGSIDPGISNGAKNAVSINAVEALQAHTRELARTRTLIWVLTGAFSTITVILFGFLFFSATGVSGKQKKIEDSDKSSEATEQDNGEALKKQKES